MWNWQYLQRFQGDYEDTRVRGLLYYVPIILGLTIPWTLALGHALAAPWMSRFRDQRRPLFFLGVWSVVGAAVMSVMGFKKPYYVLPAIPPLILLIAPIVDAFAQRPPSVVGRPRRGLVLLAAIAAVAPFVAYPILRQQMPSMATRMELPLVVLTIGVLAAVFEHGRRRPTRAVYAAAATMTAVFLSAWYAVAPSFSNFERVRTLHRQLLAAGVPEGAKLYWADQRPDARLWFYYHRRSAHLVDPADIVMQTVVRKRNDLMLQSAAIARAGALLGGPDPVYLILDREHLTLLEQIEADARARVRELTTVDVDGHPDADDWVVISNAAGPTG
jgi:4-amino-4-deoxy-L-arabinose transferase-like glycosyltransferase